MVAFGWHMHPLYDLRYEFPYHPGIRPMFVSFHVNRLEMLTDEAVAYLRATGRWAAGTCTRCTSS